MQEEVEVLTARQEVFAASPAVFAAPAPKYALPVVLHSGDEMEMDGYGHEEEDEEEDDEMAEEEEGEEEDEGMEDGDKEEGYCWSQERRQHTTTANGNEVVYRPKETTYHLNEADYRNEGTYRTTAYDHTNSNKTIYRPETATAATFANAGPPGVCFYPTPSLSAYQYPYTSASRRW